MGALDDVPDLIQLQFLLHRHRLGLRLLRRAIVEELALVAL
jgi:hypothetical protein